MARMSGPWKAIDIRGPVGRLLQGSECSAGVDCDRNLRYTSTRGGFLDGEDIVRAVGEL
jgi:hypothetical protein